MADFPLCPHMVVKPFWCLSLLISVLVLSGQGSTPRASWNPNHLLKGFLSNRAERARASTYEWGDGGIHSTNSVHSKYSSEFFQHLTYLLDGFLPNSVISCREQGPIALGTTDCPALSTAPAQYALVESSMNKLMWS